MRAQDLIDLGFKKVEVSAHTSGDKDFYYYTYSFTDGDYDLSLITSSNHEVDDGGWYAEIFEYGTIRFTARAEIELFIDLIKRNILLETKQK